MKQLYLIFIASMIVTYSFIFTVYVYGAESGIITPYNTGNSNIVMDQSPIYCGFGQDKEDCNNNIPQDVKIPKEHIWHIGAE